MQRLEATGGLRRNRRTDQSHQITWPLSTLVCAEIIEALQEFTSADFKTSDNHKNGIASGQQCDRENTDMIFEYLNSKNPFHVTLATLHTFGIVAHESMNVDHAVQLRQTTLNKIIVSEFEFMKNDRVVTLASKHPIKATSDTVSIDPIRLFSDSLLLGTTVTK